MDDEYADQGIEVSSNLASCDVLMGIKEVPADRDPEQNQEQRAEKARVVGSGGSQGTSP